MTAPKPAAPAKPNAKKTPLTEAEKIIRATARKAEGAGPRFQRIAKPRIVKILAALRRLETVARSPAYQYTPEQANAVMKYVDGAVEKVRMAFVAKVNKRTEDQVVL